MREGHREASQAFETDEKRAVQHASSAPGREHAVIVIAHRLSTTTGARQILVIDDDQLPEAGPPAELPARDGRHAAPWRVRQSVKQWRAAA
ncbi:hypothetical protein EBB59_09765 [Lysobacter pythonis]|uniref:ABC transporter ATP-binding protein n=1 Tax=Solilutibacter pythonis TaxID=2483112 RepID=A0A3M2HUY7_9GAMM|nr:hypothetical protein [Lysobacter pythonis]RMH90732.1 hypothetical protein EBB59_09765 [Lysobacter pythonis]